jgi:AAA15 family ATPase/GTPase
VSRNFYFQSIKLDNYRGFNQVNIPDLRRITIVGGQNGAGKTALLEALFMLLDRKNPAFLIRPFTTRNVIVTAETSQSQLLQIFSNGDATKTMRLEAKTKSGKEEMQLTFGPVTLPNVVNFANPKGIGAGEPPGISFQQTLPSISGVTVKVTFNGKLDQVMHISEGRAQNQLGLSVNMEKQSQIALPISTLMTPTQRHFAPLESQRFTQVVQEKKYDRLISFMQLAQPNLKSLQILQIGNQPTICGDVGLDIQIPVSFLGEGVHLLMAIGLALLGMPGGVLLLDEFDAAIHYSILSKFWVSVNQLADELGSQVIAATHSRECIQAACDGLENNGASDDLKYIRLNRLKNSVVATSYDKDELRSALNAEWEVR